MTDGVTGAEAHHDDEASLGALDHSPYEALERHDGVEYDLDGHPLPKVQEDPWGEGRPEQSEGEPT